MEIREVSLNKHACPKGIYIYISSVVGICRAIYKEKINLRTNFTWCVSVVKKVSRSLYTTYVLKRLLFKMRLQSDGLSNFSAALFFLRIKRVDWCVRDSVYCRADL